MISRRNIRVKVVQRLYVMELEDSQLDIQKANRILKQEFDKTFELFTYLIHWIFEIALYAEEDARHRASKNLPSYEDLHVNTKIAGNELLWKIKQIPSYELAISHFQPHLKTDRELLRKLYIQLTQSEQYQKYISEQQRTASEERAILEYIFEQILLPHPLFNSAVEDLFSNWDDDGEMLVQLVAAFLQKQKGFDLMDLLGAEKWDYARQLLRTAIEKKEVALGWITPRLKNWDPDRIAQLDMIIMRLGVCELLFFETIPAKVTINEYIDVAKDYSTQQSGQFVNGILDSIHKELVSSGNLQKIDFKKKVS